MSQRSTAVRNFLSQLKQTNVKTKCNEKLATIILCFVTRLNKVGNEDTDSFKATVDQNEED